MNKCDGVCIEKVDSMDKIKFIMENVDGLFIDDRLRVLKWFKNNTDMKIIECKDGCRINISKFCPKKVDILYKIVQKLMIIPDKFKMCY